MILWTLLLKKIWTLKIKQCGSQLRKIIKEVMVQEVGCDKVRRWYSNA